MATKIVSDRSATGRPSASSMEAAVEAIEELPAAGAALKAVVAEAEIFPPIDTPEDVSLDFHWVSESLLEIIEAGPNFSGRRVDELSDEDMESLGKVAGNNAFHSALRKGAKVPYLDGDQVKFAFIQDGQLRYGLCGDDFVPERGEP